MNTRLILPARTDSYKVSHKDQYPKGTTKVYSFLTPRKVPEVKSYADTGPIEIMFYGLQYYLKEYLAGHVINIGDVQRTASLLQMHFGKDIFNFEGWKHIAYTHEGMLPVEICAVPEGSVWPAGTPMMTIENTCPKCFWLTNYLETLLVKVWYPSTVATISREIKKTIAYYLNRNGDPTGLPFKLHDFGYRGVSSEESAAIGGSALLINFMGSDTISALLHIQEYYATDYSYMAGFSIPAAEHSTITSWGKENEGDALENLIDIFPDGIVAGVSDSYDIKKCINEIWGTRLKEKILSRNGTVVVRPDSAWQEGISIPTTAYLVLKELGKNFGYTTNEKGYRVLPPQIREIYGDGIKYLPRNVVDEILFILDSAGWSADNIAFGMGGGLLQQVDRDTFSWAMKAAQVTVNGEVRDVFKSPVGDPARGSTGGRKEAIKEGVNYLTPVFRDGIILKEFTFDEVRANATISS